MLWFRPPLNSQTGVTVTTYSETLPRRENNIRRGIIVLALLILSSPLSADPSPDFDGDGTVGFGDFVIFANGFGTRHGDEAYSSRFDLDSNGEVGFSDFLIFAQHFGRVVEKTVASVKVTPTTAELQSVGATVQLTVVAFDTNDQEMPDVEVFWGSSDTSVAVVNASGLVTAVARGSTTITANTDEVSGSAVVTVSITFALSGTVSDNRLNGPLLAGAIVRIESDRLNSTKTDSSGYYHFPNVWDTVTVTVSAEPHYTAKTIEIFMDADRTVNFELEHTGTPPFSGTVWVTPDVIDSLDASSLRSVDFKGRGMRLYWNRKQWIKYDQCLFVRSTLWKAENGIPGSSGIR